MDPRLQIVIELTPRHLDQWILQAGLSARSLLRPDLVEALPGDAAREVGVELWPWFRYSDGEHVGGTGERVAREESLHHGSGGSRWQSYLDLGQRSEVEGFHGRYQSDVDIACGREVLSESTRICEVLSCLPRSPVVVTKEHGMPSVPTVEHVRQRVPVHVQR